MSDFLTRLAARQLGQIVTIEPRAAPLYEGANEARIPLFAEDAEHRRVTSAQEAVAMPERTPLQGPARLPAYANDTFPPTQSPLVQTHAGSFKPNPRIDPQSFTAESRSNKAGRFPLEASSPISSSNGQPLANFPRPPQTGLENTELRPRQPVPVGPVTRTAPATPIPLVKPTHSGLTEPLNELTEPAVFGSEDGRWRAQTPRDKEPAVHVTIGRIEVTAMTGAAPAKRAPARKQTMSLDDYLARRQRRDR